MVGIEGEDVVGDTDSEVSESHRHRGALVAGLHLTEEVVLATDGHRDLLGRACRLGLGEGDDIVAETFGERGLAVFEVDVEVEVVVALRLFICLPDVDGVALHALLVFPLADTIEAARRLGVLVENPHGQEEFVSLVLGKGVDLSFHDGDDGVFRLDRHLVFDTVGMAHRLSTFPQQEGDLVGNLSLEADGGDEEEQQGEEAVTEDVHGVSLLGLSTAVIPLFKGCTRGALAHEFIEGETGIEDAPLSQEDIDLGDGILHILGLQADGLVPVEECHVVELLFGLIGCTGCIGIGLVGEELHASVELVEGLPFPTHFLKRVSQSEMSFEIRGIKLDKGLVIHLRQIVVLLTGMTVGTEIQGGEILLIEAQHVAIFGDGIVPLLQVDVRLGLLQTEFDVVGMQTDLLHQDTDRVAPLLRRLRLCADRHQQQAHY